MNAVELVKTFEGFARVVKGAHPISASPYLCPAGFWTIGYGHLCRPDQPSITLEAGQAWLEYDMGVAEAAVRALTRPRLTAGQMGALTSWVFNLGVGRFRGSTLRSVINRGELEKVPREMRRWVYAGGRKLPGLILRREAEIALWNS